MAPEEEQSVRLSAGSCFLFPLLFGAQMHTLVIRDPELPEPLQGDVAQDLFLQTGLQAEGKRSYK